MDDVQTDQIDQAAAEAAAVAPPPPPEQLPAQEGESEEAPTSQYPTLEHNQSGPAVRKLTNLLVYLGYATGETQGKEVLDGDVLGDVDAARQALGVSETPPEQVGPATWAALYEAAEAKSSGATPAS